MNLLITLFRSYFAFFLFALLIKSAFLRYLLFSEYNILNTLWYELSFVIILLATIELIFKKRKLLAYLFLDLLLSALFFSIVIYERYFETLPTYYDLGQLNQVSSVSESALMLIAKRDALFFIDFIVLGAIFVIRKIWGWQRTTENINIPKRVTIVLLLIAFSISSFHFISNRNDRILDSGLFAIESGVLTFQIIKPFREYKAKHGLNKVTVDDVIRLKGNEPIPFEDHESFGIAKDKNLIIIQLESLQNFVFDLELDGQPITPTLNQWVNDAYYFTDVFQQIGAGNTSDAEFIMNTSLYPKGETPTSKHVQDKNIPSLPKMLKKHGYHTSTFHAHKVEYWDRDKLYPALGFDEYFDIEYYGEKDVIGFGPSDGYFYDKTMDKLIEFKEENKRFYAHLLSLTSHTPFEMPEDKSYLDLPDRFKGTFIGNYLQSVHYADVALDQLFKDLQRAGLWDDSIIVLYGDHSGVHGRLVQDEDVPLLHELLGRPYTLLDRFNIPFIIGVPGLTEEHGEDIQSVGGQLDMMPTVLNIMGIVPEDLYFGHNLLQYEHNLFGMRYYLSTGAFINDELMFIPKTSRFDIRMYDIVGNLHLDTIKDPMARFSEEYEDILQIYDWADAYFNSMTTKE